MLQDAQKYIGTMLAATKHLPVVTINDVNEAVDIAKSLIADSINNIEITLRTEAALSSMLRIKTELPEMTIGAGTVMTAEQVVQCKNAGASYIVSPGFSEIVHEACLKSGIAYLPGAVTPTEIHYLQEKGYRFLKFFPAEASGGVKVLKALAPVFPDIKFCATGGITTENAPDYFSAPNIISVGMSSLVRKKA